MKLSLSNSLFWRLSLMLTIFTGWSGPWKTFAQEVSVNASLKPDKVVIGDQAVLRFEIKQPANLRVDFPLFADSLVSLVEILERKPADTSKNELGQWIISQELVITSFDSGSYVLGPFVFRFPGKQGPDSLLSEALGWYVNTLPVDTTKGIVDIKPPIETPLSFREVLPWLLIGLLITAVGFAAYWFYLMRKKKKPAFGLFQKPKEPAHVIALRDLDLLKDKKLWQQDRVKEFHSELTDILRKYFEDRFQIRAMEQTTDEILSSFSTTRLIDSLMEEKLRQILVLADLVKFAKFRPLADEHDQSMKQAYSFVLQTKESLNLLDTEKPAETPQAS